jgi:hypothetical protein
MRAGDLSVEIHTVTPCLHFPEYSTINTFCPICKMKNAVKINTSLLSISLFSAMVSSLVTYVWTISTVCL